MVMVEFLVCGYERPRLGAVSTVRKYGLIKHWCPLGGSGITLGSDTEASGPVSQEHSKWSIGGV